MAIFIEGSKLNGEIEELFDKAEKNLILISPFIKLHSRILDALKTKKGNYKLEIIVLFGKNENDRSKSLTASDFEFFKSFPNIEIRYSERLHAKFYASEHTQILSTMNLYDSSQNNNIEAGVKTEGSLLGSIGLSVTETEFHKAASNYFKKVINQSDCLYKNTPQFDSSFLNKKYKGFINEVDELSKEYSRKPAKSSVSAPTQQIGYCIRSGTKIPFNPQKPFSPDAFEIWAQYKNKDFGENFCHRTGKRSNGKTSMAKPILYEN